MFRIAWATSAVDPAAVSLLVDVLAAELPIEAVVCEVSEQSRHAGEIADVCKAYGVSVVELPQSARDQNGLLAALERFHCDALLLIGYMQRVGIEVTARYPVTLNLHPSPPMGPIGRWQDAIWSLIAVRARLAGGMLHVPTRQLDRGPVVSYYTIELRSAEVLPLWDQMEAKLQKASLYEVAAKEGETEPLFMAIRAAQFEREAPLVIATCRRLAASPKILSALVPTCLNDEVEALVRQRRSNPLVRGGPSDA